MAQHICAPLVIVIVIKEVWEMLNDPTCIHRFVKPKSQDNQWLNHTLQWPMKKCYPLYQTSRPDLPVAIFKMQNVTNRQTLLSHTYSVTKRDWDGACLTNLTRQSYLFFFKFAICSIALLNLGETCNSKVRDMVTLWRTLLLLSWHV